MGKSWNGGQQRVDQNRVLQEPVTTPTVPESPVNPPASRRQWQLKTAQSNCDGMIEKLQSQGYRVVSTIALGGNETIILYE